MKKIFALTILGILLPLSFASANYDDDVWSYVFHLQYKDDVLGVNDSEKSPYVSIPELFVPKEDPATTDFSGTIFSVKGKQLAKFGFNKPTTIVVSLGKSIMDVHAPYYANADHVSFANKAGKHLFDISLKGSSFCNDNNICDPTVGENSVNCPNDCAGNITSIEEPQTPTPPIETIIATNEETATATETPTVATGDKPSEATQNNAGAQERSTAKIILLSGGLLLVLLSFVLLYLKKRSS